MLEHIQCFASFTFEYFEGIKKMKLETSLKIYFIGKFILDYNESFIRYINDMAFNEYDLKNTLRIISTSLPILIANYKIIIESHNKNDFIKELSADMMLFIVLHIKNSNPNLKGIGIVAECITIAAIDTVIQLCPELTNVKEYFEEQIKTRNVTLY